MRSNQEYFYKQMGSAARAYKWTVFFKYGWRFMILGLLVIEALASMMCGGHHR